MPTPTNASASSASTFAIAISFQARRGQVRRSRGRQSRAVLSRSRGRRRIAAAVRRRRARRSAPVRTLGDRRADRSALARHRSARMLRKLHRSVRSARRTSNTSSTRACAGSSRRLARVRATAIRLPRTKMRGRRSTRCARRSIVWRTGSLPTAQRALKQQPANDPAEADRRRDLACASCVAHEVAIDASQTRRGRTRLRGSSAATPTAVTASTARRTRSRSFCRTRSFARTRASCSRAPRSPRIARSSSSIARSASRTRKNWSCRSPFDYARQARLFIAPADVNPKSSEFARRAAPLVEECLDRTRGRAFVLFTSYARLREVLRARCASASPSRFVCKANCRARTCSIGSAGRPARCSLRPARFGKGSTSPAMRSRA